MAKNFVEKEGTVTESLPSAMFRIQLDDGTEALATVSGRMRKYHIKILPGDRVKVEFTPYDSKRGRVVYRSS